MDKLKNRNIRFRYKKEIFAVVLCIILCVSLHYICTWECVMKTECRFMAQFENNKSRKVAADIIKECSVFPAAKNENVNREDKVNCYYENGYGDGRSFGGKRKHEGIDIMSSVDKKCLFKIRSVSDGTVEKKGWLKLGGYRLGIRSDSGIYYYYAHLASYADNIKCGDRVKAGQFIGYMGNTGYGDEGTSGKFPVHLYFGIYIKDGTGESSINPFYLLKKLEKCR